MTINILIRNKYRPELFERCINSIKEQTFINNLHVIIACDSKESRENAEKLTEKFSCPVTIFDAIIQEEFPFYWNLYSNQLKSLVNEGWFFYLDNDDYIYDSNSLEKISTKLTSADEGVICQMLRKGRPKPPGAYMEDKKVVRGKIGAPCLFLHHSMKEIADWTYGKGADYKWIKEVESKIELKFVPIVIVRTGNNGLHGK